MFSRAFAFTKAQQHVVPTIIFRWKDGKSSAGKSSAFHRDNNKKQV
jgi:hypothetical protein